MGRGYWEGLSCISHQPGVLSALLLFLDNTAYINSRNMTFLTTYKELGLPFIYFNLTRNLFFSLKNIQKLYAHNQFARHFTIQLDLPQTLHLSPVILKLLCDSPVVDYLEDILLCVLCLIPHTNKNLNLSVLSRNF